MKGYYYLIIWYVAISIGVSQNIIDGIDTINTVIGYALMMGIPTVLYLILRYRKTQVKHTPINS